MCWNDYYYEYIERPAGISWVIADAETRGSKFSGVNGHLAVITGASKPQQVVENTKAVDVVEKLTPDVMDHIERILDNKPALETDWRTA